MQMAEIMPPKQPQIRMAKRKLMVTTAGNGKGNSQSFKKVKCDFKVVSKDIEDVEYYEDRQGRQGRQHCKGTKEDEDEDEEDDEDEETYDNIYEDIQLYEENYGFPRQINGNYYYIDISNYVFHFDTKELIGKLNASQDNIILFRQAAVAINADADADAMDMTLDNMTNFVKII